MRDHCIPAIANITVCLVLLLTGCDKNQQQSDIPTSGKADLVIYGNIYTADYSAGGGSVTAEAIAVKDGKFKYVGSADGVNGYISDETEIVRCPKSQMILPGLTDGHAHYILDALIDVFEEDGQAVRLGLNDTKDMCFDAIRKMIADKHPKAVYAQGIQSNVIEIAYGPRTKEELDKISTDIPIFVTGFDLHDCWCNSNLLIKAGVMNEDGTPTGKYSDFNGGHVVIENGKCTGVCTEQLAWYILLNYMDLKPSAEQVNRAIEKVQFRMSSMGITNVLEGWANYFDDTAFYSGMKAADSDNNLGFVSTLCWNIPDWRNKNKEYLEDVDKAVRLRDEYTSTHVRANNIKLFVDGLVETGHGYIKQPYSGMYKDLGNGKPAWTAEQMKEIVTAANAKGEGVHCHVMGDLAASITIDAFAAGYNKDVRNSMCHLRNIDAPDYQKMAEKCNIACCGAMNWHAGDPGMIALLKERGIPEKYAKESYPMKSFFDAGVCFVNSSDRPCDAGTFYPFGCMQVGVTCKSTPVPEDTEWWPEEKLSREQALQAMTINGAYLAQTENERGSITKGKWADFIVIDQDVLNCPAMEIANTKVLKTYFEGKQVY